MGRAFSADFSAVRVHTGPAAHEVASTLQAHALTTGSDILFQAGAYSPGSSSGDRLLAHELAHVVQQRRGLPRASLDNGQSDPLERAADRAAEAAGQSADGEARHAALAAGRGERLPVLPHRFAPGVPLLAHELGQLVPQQPGRTSAPQVQRKPRSEPAGVREAPETEKKTQQSAALAQEAPQSCVVVPKANESLAERQQRGANETACFVAKFLVHIDGDNELTHKLGRDIVPGAGQSAPGTIQGRRLLARELSHVLQHTASSADGQHPPARKAGQPRLTQEPGSVVGQLPRPAHPAFAVQRQVAPVIRRPPFDDQPEELRRILNASFTAGTFGCRGGGDAADCFNRLETRERMVLIQLFNRLRELGISAHVRRLTGTWTEGVGGAHFVVNDQLFHDLLLGGRMCVDTPLGGMLHGGTSLREVSSGSSLHLTLEAANVAAGKVMSAHIDAVSPVAERLPGGICRYDPTRAAAHIGREVVPLAVPGLQIFPEPRPGVGPPGRTEAPPELIRLQIRF